MSIVKLWNEKICTFKIFAPCANSAQFDTSLSDDNPHTCSIVEPMLENIEILVNYIIRDCFHSGIKR